MSENSEPILGRPFGDTSREYPDVYTQIPPQPAERKPGQLTDQQIHKFFQQGYLLVEDYFGVDTAVLESCKDTIEQEVGEFAEYLYKHGQIKSPYSDLGLYQRLSRVEGDLHECNMILEKAGFLPGAVKSLWSDPRLLNAMEQFLGTRDIQGNPVWNLRTKLPNNQATTVPWHQDIGYMDNDSHRVLQMTAWIPLLDTTAHNGCMQVVRGGHRHGRVVPHYACWRDTHYVIMDEGEMQDRLDVNLERDVVTCEVPYGGVLFLSNILPHRSLPNLSGDIRWSLDLRWQRLDQPVGFHGLKDGIRLASAADEDFRPDWTQFDGGVKSLTQAMDILTKNNSDFNVLVPGPWMQKWKVNNKNEHVAALERELSKSGEYKLSWHEAQT